MEQQKLNESMIPPYKAALVEAEKSAATVEKYLYHVRQFVAAYTGRKIDKALVLEYKARLGESFAPSSANAALAAVNGFLRFWGFGDCCVKPFKIQKKIYCPEEKELTREEYVRLVKAAKEKSSERLALLLESICATGIRVGELKYITVEAIRAGVAEIALKGKIRTILLPHRLCRKLQKYAKQQKIASGKIFLTQDGLPVSRQYVWTRMKALCEPAGVERTKVFPHNLRSLFARSFYGSCHDVVRLADVLGHSSIETTRIYLMSTGKEYLRQLDKLGLVR